MARVIKRGEPPQEYRYEYTCGTCKSVIEFDRSDVHSDQREGDYVKCPVCSAYIAWQAVKENGKRV